MLSAYATQAARQDSAKQQRPGKQGQESLGGVEDLSQEARSNTSIRATRKRGLIRSEGDKGKLAALKASAELLRFWPFSGRAVPAPHRVCK